MKIRRTPRSGLSLLEVMLAMVIFLIALVGLTELMSICSRQATEISETNRANQLLEQRMNAVLSGVVPMTGQGETSFDEDSDWVWSVDSTTDNTPNLYRVTVHVRHSSTNSDTWSLSRMVFDPAQKGTIDGSTPSSSSSSSGTPGGP
jgi:prepilin-type N-terminal cleavage/methylation domain-containing protein